MKVHKALLLVLMLILVMLAVNIRASPLAHAAGPWYVGPGGSDGNACTSPATRCATINGALNKPGFVAGDTVRVAIGIYTGAGDEVALLDKSVILSGGWDNSFTTQGGLSTLDGQASRRGVVVNEDVTATIEHFLVQKGDSVMGGGGGILNSGNLTLNHSVVSQNTTNSSGGGILNVGAMTVNNSTVSYNTASDGGGIANAHIGTSLPIFMIINNSTVSQNTANSRGGGIGNGPSGTLHLNNSTVSGNSSTYFSGSGGIHNQNGVVTLQNSIIAKNTHPGNPDCEGVIGSSGYNLIGDITACEFTPGPGDLINVDPQLGPLTGSPGYHPLRVGPAVNAGNPAGCKDNLGNPLATDQRGVARVGRCDIGAYEYTGVIFYTFLPSFFRNFCPDLFDNFSNPGSGWEVVNDNFVRGEYLNGEYRILTKQAGFLFLFRAPSCKRQNYTVETDARWVGAPGKSYGLLFGIKDTNNVFFSEFYLFDMNTDLREFRLLRHHPNGFYETIVPITFSPAIKGGTATNHLQASRNGNQITLSVNGTVLGTWSDSGITGLTEVGLVSSPKSTNPTSDARFDNFRVTGLAGSSATTLDLSATAVEADSLQIPGAQRVLLSADIEW